MAISDRVAVLRKGHYIGDINTSDADENILTEMMVGQKISLNINRSLPVDPQDRLILNNISLKNSEGVTVLDDVSFTIRSGEFSALQALQAAVKRNCSKASPDSTNSKTEK